MNNDPRADRQDTPAVVPTVGGGTIWARVMGAKVRKPRESKPGSLPDAPATLLENPEMASNA